MNVAKIGDARSGLPGFDNTLHAKGYLQAHSHTFRGELGTLYTQEAQYRALKPIAETGLACESD